MSLKRNVVLLLTHSADYFTVDRVADALTRCGARPYRFDTDRFPLQIRLSSRRGDFGSSYTLQQDDLSIGADEVKAVWLRHIWGPNFGTELDPEFQRACVSESMAALHGFLDGLDSARWIDPLDRVEAGENKLRQLRIAESVGLTIPRTLVTNDPVAVRAFFQEVNGSMVAKLLRPLSISMGKPSFFVYTSEVSEEDLADAESLRYSPMVFQESIPKERELRIIFVDREFFAGALDVDQTDWRSCQADISPWQKEELPEEVAIGLTALMARLGLVFGAIDMICTPDGRYVFLEVNPTGEWGMLERDLGYPISEAIAKTAIKEE
ncbi:MAG: MvdC family ATP-grasp ribosomal peptide maturase [Acidobacteriota bacterium]